jgi:transposase
MKIRQTYTRGFKLKVLLECENGKGKAQPSREYGLHPSLITRWEKEFREDPERAFSRNGNIFKADARIGELERVIGELYAKNSF